LPHITSRLARRDQAGFLPRGLSDHRGKEDRKMQCFLRLSCALILSLAVTRQSFALVGASPDMTKPGAMTSYGIVGGGSGPIFQISDTVVLDANAGPWTKTLTNTTGSGISSGADRSIEETLTNVGAATWLGWHESILTRTTIIQPNDAPGFLFRNGSLVVTANYGSGAVTLTPGVDFTLTTTPYSGPPDPGNNQHWEAIDIVFAPGRAIETGDLLHIEKAIFEVFGDGDVWRPGDSAELSEFPLPEPTSAIACALFSGGELLRRRRHR
jgi:hypothetical protein